jgi:gamma-glutamylcyclotransferase
VELYFAYGSNMDEELIKERCDNAKFLSIAYLPEYRLGFTQYYEPSGGGVADIIESPNNKVWGKVYELPLEDLHRLDFYEGHPTDYRRTQHYVITPQGEFLHAWIYSVVDKEEDFIPPSKRYMEFIKRGASNAGFPKEYFSFLESIRTANSDDHS